MAQDNRLVECEYCRGLRVYEAGKSCPGCGASLRPPKEKPRADWQRRNDGLYQQQMQQQLMNQQIGMQNMGQYGGYPIGYQMQGIRHGGKGGW